MSSKKSSQTMSLSNARKTGKLSDFIEEHGGDPDGDLDKLDAVIKRPTQETSKATPKASSQDASDD